jgi:capsular exopolysaccharide synthesis family protein
MTHADIATRDRSGNDQSGLVNLRQVIGILWRGRRLIGISLLACATLAILNIALSKRMYRAQARILILQQGGKPLNVGNTEPIRLNEGVEDYIPTHSEILRSRLVIGRAIESVGLEQCPTLAGAEDPVDEVTERLLTINRPDRLAQIVEIGYQAASREEAVRMVEAIVASYERFLEDTFQQSNNKVVSLLGRARDELSRELRESEQKYFDFRRATPDLTAQGPEGRSRVQVRLDHWAQAVDEAESKILQLKSQVEMGRQMAGNGAGLRGVIYGMGILGPEAAGLMSHPAAMGVDSGPIAGASSDYIRLLSQEQQQLIERLGPDNSKVKMLQEQIARVEQRMRATRNGADQGDIRELLDATEKGLGLVKARHAEVLKRYEGALEQARKTELDILTDSTMKANLERQRALFSTVVDQLKQAYYVGEFGSFTSQRVELPHALPRQVRPRPVLTLFLALVCGSVLGVGAAIAADRIDPRVRTTEEAQGAFGMPILAEFASDAQATTPGRSGPIRPGDSAAGLDEPFRTARVQLDLLRRGRRVQVILVASARPAEGRTTGAANLAASMARAGRSVLLVEASLDRPALASMFGGPDGVGLAQCLDTGSTLDRAVQPSGIEGLDVLAAGTSPGGPTRPLDTSRLREILDEARGRYDTILLDSPPLLDDPDSAVLGEVADGVILAVRLSDLRRGDAQAVSKILQAIGAPVLGGLVLRPPLRGLLRRISERLERKQTSPDARRAPGAEPMARPAERPTIYSANGHSDDNLVR